MIKLNFRIQFLKLEQLLSIRPNLHDFYVSPDVMENPTSGPNSVSNILSCSTVEEERVC